MNCGEKSHLELEADGAFIACNLACGLDATPKPPGCDCEANLAQALPSARDEDALHDPRFWSNIRGTLDLEGVAERRAAHDLCECSAGMSVGEAWKEGFSRHGKQVWMPLPFTFAMILGCLLAARKIRQIRQVHAVRVDLAKDGAGR